MTFNHGDNKAETAQLIADMTAKINALHVTVNDLNSKLHETEQKPTDHDTLKAELDCLMRETRRLRAENELLRKNKAKNNIIHFKKR